MARHPKKKSSAKRLMKSQKKGVKTSRQSNRRQARVPIQLEVQYRVKQNYVVDLTQDVSPGGIFVRTRSPLPKGTTVELRFGRAGDNSPESRKRQLFVEGKVVWSKPYEDGSDERFGMGVEFARIDIEGQQFIDEMINDFLRKISIL